MGLFRHLDKGVQIRPEQKWDYITLNDFKSTSCFKPFAYAYLFFSLGLSTAVYAVDTFTAVNLLVFNKWSSEISPTISFTAAKWIFSVCIILSFVNLAYEHLRAQLIMRRGSVTECYLDNLAVRLESIRMGKGQGWKRFLVFAELTKSKKGAEYIALFTYFSFQSWFRVICCSGPRQVVNALTLYSVYVAKISASGDDVESTLLDFFNKIRTLFSQNYQLGLILSGMMFTLIIWIFSFLALLMAFFFFVFFLISYIPRSDGGLSGFCSRKVNKRLMKIVSVKVNKAIAEEERRRKKAELKAAKKNGELPPTELKATIPDIGPSADKLPQMPMLSRNDTMATLPEYTSRPGTPGGFELNSIDQKRPQPARSGTMASTAASLNKGINFSTRAPLLGYAAAPGMSNAASASPAPTIPNLSEIGGMGNYPGAPQRPGMAQSSQNFGGPNMPPNMQMNQTNTGGMPPNMQMNRTNTGGMPPNMQMNRSNTGTTIGFQQPNYMSEIPGNGGGYLANSGSFATELPAAPAPIAYGHRSNGSASSSRFGAFQDDTGRASPAPSIQPFGPNGLGLERYDTTGRASPAPSTRSFGPGGNGPNGPSGYNPPSQYNNNFSGSPLGGMPPPMRSATGPLPSRGPPDYQSPLGPQGTGGRAYQPPFAPQRNMTAPMPNRQHERQNSNESYASYFEAPVQSNDPSQQRAPSRTGYGGGNGNGWNMDVESQRGQGRY